MIQHVHGIWFEKVRDGAVAKKDTARAVPNNCSGWGVCGGP
jgi:hypothetical protein